MEKYRILIVNGVNLQQLGTREINLYGHLTFEEYLEELRQRHSDVDFDFFQSDDESALYTTIASAKDYAGIVLNAGAYTHTSITMADAIKATSCPVIEVHITNIFGREQYRRENMISAVCIGSISGFGLESYHLAVEAFKKK